MDSLRLRIALRAGLLVLAIACSASLITANDQVAPASPVTANIRTMADLQRLSATELESLFRSASVGNAPVGVARGRLLTSTDRFPRLKVRAANSVWRGKSLDEDGEFVNRWVGGIEWIGSRYVVGPSWIDGQPAILMEYPPKTPLFANTHDEIREVAPGLYLGPLYDRNPCPKFRGWIALEIQNCCR